MFARFETRPAAATRMHGAARGAGGERDAANRRAALAGGIATISPAAHASAPSVLAADTTPMVPEHAPYGAAQAVSEPAPSEYFNKSTAATSAAAAAAGGLTRTMQRATFISLLLLVLALAGCSEAAVWLEHEDSLAAVLLYFSSAMTAAGCFIALFFFAAKTFASA